MGAPKPYNGHHCWNCWNVALWLGNDEGLYNFARECWDRARSKKGNDYATRAARRLTANLGATTPDGAKYTLKATRSALIGLFADE